MKEFLKEKTDIAIGIYAIVFAIYSVIGRIMPIAKFLTPINSAFYLVLAGVGMALVMASLFFDRYILKAKYGKILILFLLVTIISSILNIEFGYRSNVTNICWFIISVVLFYTLYLRFDEEKFLKWIKITFSIMLTIWIVAVIISIVQYVLLISYTYEVHGQIRRQGFMEGRLFGIFNDPNYAAVTSLYMIVGAVWIMLGLKNKLIKAGLIATVAINAVYVVLSGSRSSLICAAFAVLIYALCCGKNFVLKKNLKTMSVVSFVLLIVVFSLLIFFGGNVVLKKVLPKLVVAQQQQDQESDTENDTSNSGQNSILQRPDNTTENISNNRFDIWKGYLKELQGNELFGLSPKNQMKYIKANNPDGYISQSGYETHNGYLSVYVSTGIIGIIVVGIFLACIMFEFIRAYFTKKDLSQNFIFVVLIVGMILINAFFFTELFFVNNITTVLFYSLLGIAFDKKEKELV